MNVKTDTKEKFTVITPVIEHLSANMTEELDNLLLPYLQKDIPHIIFNMKNVSDIDDEAGVKITDIQQRFYDSGHSFVICEITPAIEDKLDRLELLELMNTTPTESEAWDIVQMEEIERELLGNDDSIG